MIEITQLLKGLEIIMKYEPKAEVISDKDQIFISDNTGNAIKLITTEDKLEMEKLDWFIWNNTWTIYC